MHVTLATTTQSLDGLKEDRTIGMTSTDPATIVGLFAADSAGQSTGLQLVDGPRRTPIVLRAGQTFDIKDGSTFVGYTLIRGGAPTSVWVDAERIPAGTPGLAAGVRWDKPAADATAATLTAEHAIFRAAAPCTVTGARFIPDGALTSHDTTYKTLVLARRDADGTNSTSAASVNTKTSGSGGSGDFAANVAVPLTLGAGVTLTAGQVLTVAISKNSTGVVWPAGVLVVDLA